MKSWDFNHEPVMFSISDKISKIQCFYESLALSCYQTRVVHRPRGFLRLIHSCTQTSGHFSTDSCLEIVFWILWPEPPSAFIIHNQLDCTGCLYESLKEKASIQKTHTFMIVFDLIWFWCFDKLFCFFLNVTVSHWHLLFCICPVTFHVTWSRDVVTWCGHVTWSRDVVTVFLC